MKLDEFNANQANNDKIIKGREFGKVPNDEFRFFSDNVVNNKDGLNSRKVENDENKGEKVEGEVQGEKRQKDEFSKDEVEKTAKSSNQGLNSSSSSSSSGDVASSTSAATSASAVTTSVATAASVVAVASVSIAAGVSVITGLNVKCDLKEFLMFNNRVEYNLMLDAESDGPLDDITKKYIINVYNDNYEKSNELHFGENRGEFTNLTNGQKYNLVVKEDSDLGGTLLERVFTLDFPDEISEFKGLIFDKTANFDDNTFVISLDYIDEKNIFSDFEFYLEETNTQKSYTYVLEKTTEKQTLSTFDLSKNIDFNIESGTFKYKLSYKENGEVITSESEPFTFANNVPPKEKIYASFNPNGGSGTMEDIEITEEGIYLPECSFTYEGYEFIGWTIKDSGDDLLPVGQHLSSSISVELLAHWQEIQPITTCIVSFNSNGGTGSMKSIGMEKGYYTLPQCDFTYENHSFAGWVVDGITIDVGEEIYVDKDTIIIASWTKDEPISETFMVSFNANGGTGSMAPIEDISGEYNLPEPDFFYEGYDFVGWKINNEGNILEVETPIDVNKDIVLYAQWSESIPATYTVSFNSNGGSGDMFPLENVSGEIPVPSCDYIYDGYEFAGWKVNNEGELVTLEDTLVVNDDIVLFAQWASSKPADASISEVVYSSEANFDNQIIYITLVYFGDEAAIDNLGLTLTNNTTNESRYASVEKTPEMQPVSFYDRDNPATFINGKDSYTCVLSYEINGVAGSLENESLVTFIDSEHQSDPDATLNNVIINSTANFTDKKISLTLQYENYGSSDLNDFFLNITNVTKQESYQVALTATTIEQDVQLDSTFPLNNKDDYSYVITYMNADGEQSYSSDEYIQFIDPSYIESLVNGVTISPDMNFKEGNFTLVLDYVQGNETISDVKLTLKDVNDQNKTATFNLDVISSDQSFNLYEHNLDTSTSYTYTLTYMIDGYPLLLEGKEFSFVDTYVSSATVDSITFVNNEIDLSTGIFSFVVNGQDPDGDISHIVLTMSQGDNIQQFEITSLNETYELKFEDSTSGNFAYSLTYINYIEESQINGEISLNDTQPFTWGGVTFGNELVDIDNQTMPLWLDYTGDIAQQYSSLTLYISEPTGGDAIPFDLALTKDEQSVLIGSANVSYGYGYSYYVTIKGTKIDGTGEDDLYTGDMSFIRQSSVSGFSLTSENISDNNYGFEYNLTIVDDNNQYNESPKIVIRTSQNVDYVYECEAYYGSTGGPFIIYINNFENSDGQTTKEELISEFQDVTILFSYFDNASGETIYIVLEKGVTFY